MRAQERRDFIGNGQASPDARQVARPAAIQRKTAERAAYLRQTGEFRSDGLAQVSFVDKKRNGIETGVDCRHAGQRGRQSLGEKARTGAGYGPVDFGEQAAAPLARKRADQFEVGAGGRVDRHYLPSMLTAGRREAWTLSELGEQNVVQERAGNAQFGGGKGTVAFKRRHSEIGFQAQFAIGTVKARRREGR